MPTYDYACTECDHAFEHFQSMTSDPLSECPECHGKLRRLIGRGGALIFKGSGFYETDYKRGGNSDKQAKGEGKPEAASKSEAASKPEPSSSSSTSSSSANSTSAA